MKTGLHRRNRLAGILVFIGTAAVFVVLGPTAPQGGDTVPGRYLAAGTTCGDLTLNRYASLWGRSSPSENGYPYYAVRAVTGDLVSTFGPAVPVLSSPAFFMAKTFGVPMDSGGILGVARVLASILCATAALFVFLACLRFASMFEAVAATVAFAFGTGVLSVASRGLWQHTWATPLVAAGFWALLHAVDGRHGRYAYLAGFLLSLAFACRPQTGLYGLGAGLALLAARRERFAGFASAAFPVIALVAAWNTWFFDSPFAFGQTVRSMDVVMYKTGTASLTGDSPMTGLLGLLVSPSRGLLALSPVMGLGLAGCLLSVFRRHEDASGFPTRKDRAAFMSFFLSSVALLVVASFWFDWWGGYTVSYRPIIEMLPILAVGLAHVIHVWRGPARTALFAATLLWSVAMAGGAATHPGVVMWNEEVDVDHHPERVFDLRESLPLRILQMRPSDRSVLADSHAVSLEGCEPHLESH